MPHKDKEVQREYLKRWREKNIDRIKAKRMRDYYENIELAKARSRAWREKNKPRIRALAKKNGKIRRETYKSIVLEEYGNECTCCGFKNRLALTMDHINGGGRKEREVVFGGHMWATIIKLGFPDHLQIHCANCNMAKLSGIACPIKRGEHK